VPLVISDKWITKLSGITLSDPKITVQVDGKKVKSVRGKLLFTHTGVSGPTILNMSSEVRDLLYEGLVTLELDLFPEQDEGALRKTLHATLDEIPNQKIKNSLIKLAPKALVAGVLEELGIDGETPGHSFRSDDRKRFVANLKRMRLTVAGLLGADKAVVSSGGVDLKEVNFKTMESRLVSRLYLVGDMLDIDRPSGGYSLQLCWSTGFVAGEHA
jgi:predicted Rossmann fold flavoprotein